MSQCVVRFTSHAHLSTSVTVYEGQRKQKSNSGIYRRYILFLTSAHTEKKLRTVRKVAECAPRCEIRLITQINWDTLEHSLFMCLWRNFSLSSIKTPKSLRREVRAMGWSLRETFMFSIRFLFDIIMQLVFFCIWLHLSTFGPELIHNLLNIRSKWKG